MLFDKKKKNLNKSRFVYLQRVGATRPERLSSGNDPRLRLSDREHGTRVRTKYTTVEKMSHSLKKVDLSDDSTKARGLKSMLKLRVRHRFNVTALCSSTRRKGEERRDTTRLEPERLQIDTNDSTLDG